ncbi:MAG: hypothetical protein UY82_C0061G0004 [Candidatus Uhrbacteria bacterium GW2011_GWC2_53_7]|uniref:Uncharacterized protein n=1 Tax=Candidatus Uhrbacteria bacterium GW2011_GWC2_53_7 TaxID=1618986 RepID=A0A0G1XUS6_9BACT|nr:MAG: hypothetical protein UY82_C0061G0004 [Candidatus Uhrbacteria bacterium GW2011_GWC2_53_7]
MYLFVSPHDLSSAVFGLVERVEGGKGGKVREVRKVETQPERILQNLIGYLEDQGIGRKQRSSTALRAGLSVVNTIAFVQNLPLLALSNKEEKPLEELVASADLSKTERFAIPYYEKEPRITKQKEKRLWMNCF